MLAQRQSQPPAVGEAWHGRGGGITAALVGSVASAPGLGARETWPPGLAMLVDLVQASPLAMCLLWGNDHQQIYNDAYAALLGDAHPHGFALPAAAFFAGPAPLDRATLARVLQGHSQSFEMREYRCQRAAPAAASPDAAQDGRQQRRWADVTMVPVGRDAPGQRIAGRAAGILVTAIDVTAKVHHTVALEAENAAMLRVNDRLTGETAWLRSFFQQAPSFMAILRGAHHAFELTNDSFLRLIGQVDVAGKPLLEALPELETQDLHRCLDGAFRTGEAFVGREMAVQLRRLPCAPPEQRLIDIVLQPIIDDAGAVYGLFLEGSDVTQRIRAEDALRRLNENLEDTVEARTRELRAAEETLRQAQKMETVGQLTGGIAHDFNNLLGAILGGLELMRLRLGDGQLEELPRYIEAATSSANRAAALTHRLLAFSRRQTLDPRPTDVTRLVTAMGDLIRRTVGPAIRTETITEDALWPTLCDPNQLEISLLNLAVNARDAMPDGGDLTISATNVVLMANDTALQPDTMPGSYVAIRVCDSGTGMTQAVREKAFDPFFTTKPAGQGTGLGLSMVYGFAKQSGGQVMLESAPGAGCVITLYLPWCAAPPEPVAEHPAISRARAAAGERILIVDDETELREVVAEIVGELGYETAQADGAEAALQRLRNDPHIDLLLTDIGMPVMNGCQLADVARRLRPGLKVIFMTGYVDHTTLNGGLVEPGMHMLTKPFTNAALARTIRVALENKGQHIEK